MIFNFMSAHAVEDFEFNWQKRILKFNIKTHTLIVFLFSAEKQFYRRIMT